MSDRSLALSLVSDVHASGCVDRSGSRGEVRGATVKVCIEDGCPTLTESTRCTKHARAKDKARGTRQERGYDATHDALRAQWAPLVATGMVKCWRCRLPIGPDEWWDLGHDDHDRDKYRGPEHIACNRATSGR